MQHSIHFSYQGYCKQLRHHFYFKFKERQGNEIIKSTNSRKWINDILFYHIFYIIIDQTWDKIRDELKYFILLLTKYWKNLILPLILFDVISKKLNVS